MLVCLMKINSTLFLFHRHGTAFRLKKYRNYRRIIAEIQATFLQNKGYSGLQMDKIQEVFCKLPENTGKYRAMPVFMEQ